MSDVSGFFGLCFCFLAACGEFLPPFGVLSNCHSASLACLVSCPDSFMQRWLLYLDYYLETIVRSAVLIRLNPKWRSFIQFICETPGSGSCSQVKDFPSQAEASCFLILFEAEEISTWFFLLGGREGGSHLVTKSYRNLQVALASQLQWLHGT